MNTKQLEENLVKSVAELEEAAVMAKSRVGSYTRKDGTFVKEHDDGKAARPKADAYGHPNVVGHADKLQGGDAKKAHGFHFAGKEFSASGKEGKSFHDGTPVRHFRELTGTGNDDGEHVWMDHSGRVHADATSDVPRLRKQYEAHQGKSKK